MVQAAHLGHHGWYRKRHRQALERLPRPQLGPKVELKMRPMTPQRMGWVQVETCSCHEAMRRLPNPAQCFSEYKYDPRSFVCLAALLRSIARAALPPLIAIPRGTTGGVSFGWLAYVAVCHYFILCVVLEGPVFAVVWTCPVGMRTERAR